MPETVNGPEGVSGWDVINWAVHEQNVARLRQRIFTAARDGDWPKVRNLQRMMLQSWSNTLVSVRQVTQRNAGRRTPRGLSYTAGRVQGLRHYRGIPRHQPPASAPAEGELLNVAQAARQLGIAPSTLLRWLNDGFIAGEQVTPGAPWRVRLTGQLRGMLTDTTPDGWVALHHASRTLGISRQTVLQKVKRGELRAVLTRTGRRKGLRIEIPTPQDGLF